MTTTQLTDEQVADNFREHAQKITDSLKKAGESFFGDKAPKIEYDETEPCIRIDDGMLDIYPGTMKSVTFRGEREIAAFEIITYKHYPGTRLDPPDCVDESLGTWNGPFNVAAKAFQHWFRLVTDGYFDAEGEAAAYAEMAEDED